MQFRDQFDENLIALAALMTNGVIIGKNSKRFDIPFIQYFIKKYSKDLYDIADTTARLGMSKYDKVGIVYHESHIQGIDMQEFYAPIYRVKKYLNETGKPDYYDSDEFTHETFNSILNAVDNKKRGKLEEYIEGIPGGKNMVDQIFAYVCPNAEGHFHSGMYDAAATYVVFLYYLAQKERLGL